MKQIIGLTGRTANGIAGCGKDTVAKMISEQLNYRVYGFADPLYAMVEAGFSIAGKSEEWQDRDKKKAPIDWLSSSEKKISLRYLLETLGTEWGRNLIQKDLWLRIASKAVEAEENGIIIKDVRFPNEVVWLDSLGGILVHVLRPQYFGEDASSNHQSNQPLPIREKDVIIMNDSTLDILRERVSLFIESL